MVNSTIYIYIFVWGYDLYYSVMPPNLTTSGQFGCPSIYTCHLQVRRCTVIRCTKDYTWGCLKFRGTSLMAIETWRTCWWTMGWTVTTSHECGQWSRCFLLNFPYWHMCLSVENIQEFTHLNGLNMFEPFISKDNKEWASIWHPEDCFSKEVFQQMFLLHMTCPLGFSATIHSRWLSKLLTQHDLRWFDTTNEELYGSIGTPIFSHQRIGLGSKTALALRYTLLPCCWPREIIGQHFHLASTQRYGCVLDHGALVGLREHCSLCLLICSKIVVLVREYRWLKEPLDSSGHQWVTNIDQSMTNFAEFLWMFSSASSA